MNTTLNRIRSYAPCASGWATLLTGLGKTHADDEPLPLVRILEINDLDDAIWALRAVDDCPQIRLFACACARQALPIWDAAYPNDRRPLTAIETAERFARGEVPNDELDAARAAAWDAAGAAAGAAAWDAARAAARDAARAAARDAAWDAAGAAAGAAAWDAQTQLFKEYFS
jgi:hypothetical protein